MPGSINEQIEKLIQYGLNKNLIEQWDVDYVRNTILAMLGLNEVRIMETGDVQDDSPADLLAGILDWAAENGILEQNTVTFRDLLDTEIMGAFVPRPSTVIRRFFDVYKTEGPKAATEFFYRLSRDSHYIRTDRIAKNEHWYSPTPYGELEITINLSKPEKDPAAIAAERDRAAFTYPECLLCKENVGYAGRLDHPARQNHRVIPVQLNKEQWFLQFSPYVYYHEHAIVFSGEHRPMKISKAGFDRLLDFVEQFPHYFVGSNADLPIVGGSILSHDHFQGGHHDFPMAKAEMESSFTFTGYEGVQAGILKWPMSVIRLRGKDRRQISELASLITNSWKYYSDPESGILAHTGTVPHNTVTPIARRSGEDFEFDLVLRNNRTSEEHPLGIFHPHEEVHHIKKENIGLIEVMGLAVLPGRLKEELQVLGEYLLEDDWEYRIHADERTRKHAAWAASVRGSAAGLTSENVQEVLREEVGRIFSVVLEHAGVFKRTAEGQKAFQTFIESIQK
ncbi:MAG TPA: UDP-glucose--hexose-1-phosphate uridylyltransferase [Bacillaceae bacterium]